MTAQPDTLSPGQTDFAVWKTIKLGTHKTVADLKTAITSSGCRIADWADDLMKQAAFTLAAEETEVDLVVKSVADLGFVRATPYRTICVKAQELGLALCPSEVGPQLRLQYLDQPKGEWLRVAMDPITGSGGDRGVFSVGRGGNGRWLVWHYGDPDGTWFPGDRFVFVLPRK
jgi:hypothetical protein